MAKELQPKDYPGWLVTAMRNQRHFNSDDYYMLMDDAIKEYNRAIHEKNDAKMKKWQAFILKWTNRKITNANMLQQGGVKYVTVIL